MDRLSSERRFNVGLGTPQYIDRLLEGSNPTLIWGIIIALSIHFHTFWHFLRPQERSDLYRWHPFLLGGYGVFDSLRRYGWHRGPRRLHGPVGDGSDCSHETQGSIASLTVDVKAQQFHGSLAEV